MNFAKFLRTSFLQKISGQLLPRFYEFKVSKDVAIFTKSSFTSNNRTSSSQMFFKIGVFKKLAILKGKEHCWSLFLIMSQ